MPDLTPGQLVRADIAYRKPTADRRTCGRLTRITQTVTSSKNCESCRIASHEVWLGSRRIRLIAIDSLDASLSDQLIEFDFANYADT
jgi:hypothetical protein